MSFKFPDDDEVEPILGNSRGHVDPFMASPLFSTLHMAVVAAIRSFAEAGLAPPTAMVCGADVHQRLMAHGLRPNQNGTWLYLCGVEIR